ncbi:Uncharacterised protein [Chlamydia trachomatis]|nr:Uncharacterised protein [Chlamydia trachomatis]
MFIKSFPTFSGVTFDISLYFMPAPFRTSSTASARPSAFAASSCAGSSFSAFASLPKPSRLPSFLVLSTTKPLTAAASAVFFFSMASAALRSATLWADSALSCSCFAFSASSRAFCSLYCIAVRCFLSEETPRCIPRTSAVMVCISAMSCRLSLIDSPLLGFVQSATRWA